MIILSNILIVHAVMVVFDNTHKTCNSYLGLLHDRISAFCIFCFPKHANDQKVTKNIYSDLWMC